MSRTIPKKLPRRQHSFCHQVNKVDSFRNDGGNKKKQYQGKICELGATLFKKNHQKFSGNLLVCISPSFNRELKLIFLTDVGRISRSGHIMTDLGTGSLKQVIIILTSANFKPIINTEKRGESVRLLEFV